MYFDLRLWRMTAGLRGRILAAVLIGLLALACGIGRFVLLGQFLARVFRGAPTAALVAPLLATAVAIILRAVLDHVRTVIAHHTSARVQETLRGRLYDKILALGPAWFGAERTGGVMLSVVDGVEQLQTFFGQYLPQVAIAVCAPLAIFAVITAWDVPVALVMLAASTELTATLLLRPIGTDTLATQFWKTESRSSSACFGIVFVGIWWTKTSVLPTSKTPPRMFGSLKIIMGNPALNSIPASS